MPLILYTIVDAGFSVYLMYLTSRHVYEWQLPKDIELAKGFGNTQLIIRGSFYG